MRFESTKIIELGSCAFRQWKADSHCKFVHGYRLQAKFWFTCSTLDERNWVVDFGGLKGLKEILEKQFDHTLCVAGDDPLLEGFKSLHAAGGCDLRIMPDGVGIEKTAEWCFHKANEYCKTLTNGRCWATKVEVWEHDKNSAIYSNESSFGAPVAAAEGHAFQPPVNQMREFLKEVEAESGVPVSNILKQVPPTNTTSGPQPAPVGNRMTTGWSNLFGGTSWGS